MDLCFIYESKFIWMNISKSKQEMLRSKRLIGEYNPRRQVTTVHKHLTVEHHT